MIASILKDLEETWGYSTEELTDIREKLEEISYFYYWDGYNDRSNEVDEYYKGFAYGKKEDQE